MMGHTPLPSEVMPLLQEAQRVSLEEYIPSTYKEVDQEATASLFNFTRPLGMITARELLERSLYETL